MNENIHPLLIGAAEGDMSAFGELYSLLSVRIFNYARTITGNKEVAEDITHDVFIQILKNAQRLAKAPNPMGYIMVTARNCAFDCLKRGKRADIPLEHIAEASDAESLHTRLFVEDAFSRLPANQRETMYLYHICGFSQKEVAQIMGAPLPTVKWRCGKALAQLQDYFQKD